MNIWKLWYSDNVGSLTRKEIDFITTLQDTGLTDKQIQVVLNDLVAIATQQQKGIMA